jgi:hypothetical protein
MTRRRRWPDSAKSAIATRACLIVSIALTSGCAANRSPAVASNGFSSPSPDVANVAPLAVPVRAAVAPAVPTQSPAQFASYPTPTPPWPPAPGEIVPIDLATALRLVDANNPTVALARRRVDEAYARERQAEVLWLPDLRSGVTYDRNDGRAQNSNGSIFTISKQNLLAGGGAALDWNTPEILFGPLVAQRQTAAEINFGSGTIDVGRRLAQARIIGGLWQAALARATPANEGAGHTVVVRRRDSASWCANARRTRFSLAQF